MKFLDEKGCRKSKKNFGIGAFASERMKEGRRSLKNKNPLRMLRDPEG